jgi:hypothetical protein
MLSNRPHPFRPTSNRLPWLVLLLALVAATPLSAQRPGARHGAADLIFQPVFRAQLHAYEPGWAMGLRVGLPVGDDWLVGLAFYRFVNDIDTGPAPVLELSPQNGVVSAEHYRNISMFGFDGSWMFRQTPWYRVGLGLFAGLVTFVRVQEWYEFFAYDIEGQPLNTALIQTGREVSGIAEPSIRMQLDLTRRIRLGLGAGYLWSTRPSARNTTLDSFSLRLGIGYGLP